VIAPTRSAEGKKRFKKSGRREERPRKRGGKVSKEVRGKKTAPSKKEEALERGWRLSFQPEAKGAMGQGRHGLGHSKARKEVISIKGDGESRGFVQSIY